MQFNPTPIPGASLIDLEMRGDDRGFFARLYCEREFAQAGFGMQFVQINNSLSRRRGTLRGMHYQLPEAAEVKVVRCIHGALFDVIVDLRPDSPTFRRWYGAELSAENRRMMVVPRGCAHGFLTLAPDTEALYLVSASYAPARERGLRYDDPAFRIEWPFPPEEISAKDRQWPSLDADFHGLEALRGLA
jgi:dTDP-4-dehydrorhamnose 3,5-epimerase